MKLATHLHSLTGCTECSRDIKSGRPPRTRSYAQKILGKHVDCSKVPEIVVHGRRDVRFEVTCRLDGHTWTNYWEKMTSCPKCTKRRIGDDLMLSRQQVIKDFEKVHGDNYDYNRVEYTGNKNYVTVGCKKCGKDFEQSPSDHKNGHGCPRFCYKAPSARIVPLETVVTRLSEMYPEYKVDFEGYYNLMSDVKVKCSNPKHPEYISSVHRLLHVAGCQICSRTAMSKVQKSLIESLPKGIYDSYVIKEPVKLELDLFWPEHNLGVEVDGVHWHSDDRKEASYHYDKTLAYKKEGIQVLHFWDYEVINKLDLVVSMIKQRMGIYKRLQARKLNVEVVSQTDAKNFFNEHHLRGFAPSKVSYGLRAANGRLAMVMSFGKPRFDKNAEWELIRLASHRGVSVVGGASRLLKAFERDIKPKSLLSYADLRYSQGSVYKQMGFSYVSRSSFNYQWHKNGLRLSRYETQKHKLCNVLEDFDHEKSEEVNMRDHGFRKIYDCGNLKFVKKYLT